MICTSSSYIITEDKNIINEAITIVSYIYKGVSDIMTKKSCPNNRNNAINANVGKKSIKMLLINKDKIL